MMRITFGGVKGRDVNASQSVSQSVPVRSGSGSNGLFWVNPISIDSGLYDQNSTQSFCLIFYHSRKKVKRLISNSRDKDIEEEQ